MSHVALQNASLIVSHAHVLGDDSYYRVNGCDSWPHKNGITLNEMPHLKSWLRIRMMSCPNVCWATGGSSMQQTMLFTRDVRALFGGIPDSQIRSWIRQGKLNPQRVSRWNFLWSESEIATIKSLLEAKQEK